MKIYQTEKVETTENFRAKLSQYMSVKRMTFEQDIYNMGNKCKVGDPPSSSPSTVECARLCTPNLILGMFFLRLYLKWNFP